MSISYLWSRSLLMNRYFLWLLFVCNLLGTVYGYIWYAQQMVYTMDHNPFWQVIFVPDSPTASLFFTIAVLFLLYPPKSLLGIGFRHLVEALAVVTSVKYGIWAVSIIFASVAQGSEMVWQDWMLVASHTAMAVEALIYVRFFKFGGSVIIAAAAWTFLNDTVDYTYGIFPWLPQQLNDDVSSIQFFTFGLTLFSALITWLALKQAKRY
ncbi:DUF1405 domain-containing protein [Paenibacillus pini]|uniref:Transmembrane protein n=1 Tax=Paenibacillus pini JCM 16418 TaxID=1236976 RepID=W7YDV6_9BACL|nr:DUF1405 domain-containing protein [Paenibacillus pini]GAF09085.1 transmembrane protein [Paenibacillus pini JCM 16418]